jgi:hypothetical protein
MSNKRSVAIDKETWLILHELKRDSSENNNSLIRDAVVLLKEKRTKK